MKYLAQQAINALQLGSIYALIALGYSMVYGVLTMINFAHGDVFMLGSFFCLLLIAIVPVPFWLALIVVMGATAILGTLIERFAYRPLRNAPRVSAIITALGCGLVIQNTTLGISPYARPMPHLLDNVTYQFAGITVTTLQIIIIGVSVGLMRLVLSVAGLETPALQAMLSGSTDADRQGELQGLMASLTSLAGIAGPLGMATIYAATAKTMPGFVWLLGAALSMACAPFVFASGSAKSGHKVGDPPPS